MIEATILKDADVSDPLNQQVYVGWKTKGASVSWGGGVLLDRDYNSTPYVEWEDVRAAIGALVEHLILNPPPLEVVEAIRQADRNKVAEARGPWDLTKPPPS